MKSFLIFASTLLCQELAESMSLESASLTKIGPTYNLPYQGGPIMTDGVNIYPIYYGKFTSTTRATLRDFMINLPKSVIWNNVKEYYKIVNGQKVYATSQITVMPDKIDTTYSVGKVFNDRNAVDYSLETNELYSKIVKKFYPQVGNDPKAIYAVFTDSKIESNLPGGITVCKEYFAYHSGSVTSTSKNATISIMNIAACTEDRWRDFYANGSKTEKPISADWTTVGMQDMLKHEIIETITNPGIDGGKSRWAWYDDQIGYENEDLCQYVHAPYNRDAYGRRYNIQFPNGKKYLMQATYSRTKKLCVVGNQNTPVKSFCKVGEGYNYDVYTGITCTKCPTGQTSDGIVSSCYDPATIMADE